MDISKRDGVLRAQLTIARWYIDRARYSTFEHREHCLQYAREALEMLQDLQSKLVLGTEERSQFTKELDVLRDHLEEIRKTLE